MRLSSRCCDYVFKNDNLDYFDNFLDYPWLFRQFLQFLSITSLLLSWSYHPWLVCLVTRSSNVSTLFAHLWLGGGSERVELGVLSRWVDWTQGTGDTPVTDLPPHFSFNISPPNKFRTKDLAKWYIYNEFQVTWITWFILKGMSAQSVEKLNRNDSNILVI